MIYKKKKDIIGYFDFFFKCSKLTSRAVIEAYIERIRDVNPILNAVVEDRFEAAVEEAKIVDRFISDSIKTPKQIEQETPLLGVPITVKECCRLAGKHYFNIFLYCNFLFKTDETFYRNLILGKFLMNRRMNNFLYCSRISDVTFILYR